MTRSSQIQKRVVKVRVRVQVGENLLAASDDPLFLGLRGEDGREFRLSPAEGRALRRGGEDLFVLAGPDDPETNVANPEFNDPTAPPLDASTIERVFLTKGFEPIPNVRAFGEMDDRLEEMVAHGSRERDLRAYLREVAGHRPMMMDGLRKVLDGLTSLREIGRAVPV